MPRPASHENDCVTDSFLAPGVGDYTPRLSDKVWCFAILLGLAFVVYVSVEGEVFQPLFESLQSGDLSEFILRPSLLWAAMGILFLVFRTLLWFQYRPAPPATANSAPRLTVVIPAYNEGPMVEAALYSVLEADYPSDRLEVVAVDDGSTDDTWQYIQRAAARYPNIVTPIRFETNKGKRSALEEGFRRARGEIVVTVDSDSVVEKNTLLAITGPFRDQRVGAVAGKVVAYNWTQGLIPRMLHVRYVLSFDFLRAVQSTYGTVYCCPGALSAYRLSCVRLVLNQWVNQKFLGRKCTYGEDRALTNFILAAGYNSVYQRTARVRTIVPWSYGKLCKMYLRWDRSYIRETIHFSKIVWARPFWPKIISVVDLVITNLRYPIGWLSLVLLIMLSIHDPLTILRLFCIMGLASALTAFYYIYAERSFLFPYGILYAYFSFLTLLWIFPYALLTVRSSGWGTR